MSDAHAIADTDIAVVGMSGRFPGAPDPDALWRRVLAAEDCLTDLSRQDLLDAGVPPHVADDPAYVRRTGLLDDVERFDAELFGIGARDAAVMDPQHRHFMECAWAALESAAIVPARFDGSIGVFAGSGMNTYLLNNLLADRRLLDELGWFLLRHTGNDKDFLATEVSYRLDLRGPSVNVQTACSTSLVAVHLAVQSLLGFECDAALAGGVTIEVPQRTGHLHQEGEILSADGRCRAFDARSSGTVLTSGVGVVVLRRLSDAVEDGDPVLAVIKGTAVNNDGSRKVSYLAPSVDGHAEVVREALAVAGLDPSDLQFLEAHGTGTALGDPIEFAALCEAFAGAPAGGCRLGSTKPNVGHLDTAAGAVSLIKVIQAMRHRTLPGLANHTGPSELIPLEGSPFELSGAPAPWPSTATRRAGVSSLGVGGTNAHAVVEEAPAPAPRPGPEPVGPHLLVLSAASDESLVAGAARLADALVDDDPPALVDVAHTLAVGRAALRRRRVVVASDHAEAASRLRELRPPRGDASATVPRTVFVFPGGGSQYVAMGAGLGARCAAFERTRAELFDVIASVGGVELGPLMQPDVAPEVLDAPTVALPAVFATTLAMAAQWRAWGVEPDAMLGHSLGEYAAAYLAGVIGLEDAARLVVVRAGLMERVGGPDAAMLVVPLDETSVAAHLGPSVSLAVVNAPDEVVLAGRADAIDAVAATLAREGVDTSRVRLAAAAHSVLLDPVLDEFREVARAIRFAPPERPYISNLSGTWAAPEEVTDPEHWVRHLRGTVRFADGLRTVLADGPAVTVEIGPGHSLSATARRLPEPPVAAVASMRHPRSDQDDAVAALDAVGQVWAAGGAVDPTAVADGTGRRVTLPTYAFTGDRHWIESAASPSSTTTGHGGSPARPARLVDTSEMWWERTWSEAPTPVSAPARRWWVVADEHDPRAATLGEALRALGHELADVVAPGVGLELRDGDGVVLLGAVAGAQDGVATLDLAARRWLADAAAVVGALGSGATADHRFVLVTEGAAALDGPAERPTEALARGVGLVAGREHPELQIRLVDVAGAPVDALADEIAGAGDDGWVVLAGDRRLVPQLVSTTPQGGVAPPIGEDAAVLVTGGLGGVGSVLAGHLARRGATLAVVTGSPLPDPADWSDWRAAHGPRDRTSVRIDRIEALRRLGGAVEVVEGDVGDPEQVHRIVAEAIDRIGPLDAIVHAAGSLRDAPIELLDDHDVDRVIGAKARGALALVAAAGAHHVPLVCLVSSTSTEIGPPGQAAYVAASAVLDELAGRHGDVDVVTFGSGMWSGIGMAEEFTRRTRLGLGSGAPIAHPVFEEVVRDDRLGVVDVVGHLDAARHAEVGDHRDADGNPVLPGTGHLWLLIDALRCATGATGPVGLHDVMLHEPLLVPDGETVIVRVRVEGDDAGRRVSLESARGTEGWTRHSSADVREGDAGAPLAADDALDGVRQDIDPFAGQRDHLRLGPRWAVDATASVCDRGSVGRLRTDAAPVRSSIDVAVLDAATGLAVQVLRRCAPGDQLWVPIGYREVRWTASPAPGDVEARVVRPDADVSLFDLALVDSSGATVVQIDGLELWPVDESRLGVRADSTSPTAVRGLAGLADADGIRADEGGQLLDALLADGRHRLLGSTIDLPWLVADVATQTPGDPTVAPDAGADAVGATTAETLALAWEALLGVDAVDPDDDFFELGGHSLIAIRLLARVKRTFGVELQLAELLAVPTLSEMAALVDERAGADVVADAGADRLLVDFGGDGRGLPLHVVHGAGGGVMFLWTLSRALEGDRRVVGIQARGIDGRSEPDASIDDMADRYVDALVDAGPGPYLLAGYSGGGLVALEMAERLRGRGERVLSVLLFDSVPPGRAAPRRRQRVRSVLGHLARGRWTGVAPYLRDLVGHGFHKTAPQNHVDEEVDRISLFDHFSAVAERHALGSYGGRIDLFKADQVWPIQPWDYYWSSHVTGELHIVSVPGDHFSMFSPELVGDLAAAVSGALSVVDP